MKIEKIIIVTGVSNIIGKEFLRYYSYDDSHMVIGISRSQFCNYSFPNAKELLMDLLITEQITAQLTPLFDALNWTDVLECMIIHTSGKVKNDQLGTHQIKDIDGDGVDDEMYAAQITTFHNLHNFMVDYIKAKSNDLFEKIQMTIVGFTSMMDFRYSPIHVSIKNVNDYMRQVFHKLSLNYNYRVRLFALSTVATDKEKEFRAYADQTFWLTGTDVRRDSIPIITNKFLAKYHEEPLFTDHPVWHKLFEKETAEEIMQRFAKEIGIERKAAVS